MTTNRRGMIAAMSVLSVTVLLFAAALARALTLEPVLPAEAQAAVQTGAPDGAVSVGEPSVPSETVLSTQDIALAVDHDPFLPDRSRPEAYRLPGEDVLEIAEAPPALPVPNFQLAGTIVAGDAGVAVIHVDDATPQVLGVGESLLGFRLEAVAATTATLVRGERTLYLTLASGSPQDAPASSRTGRNADSNAQISADVMRTLQERFGEGFATMLQRAQRGGDQAQAQAFIEQMVQQGGRGRGNVVRMRRDTTDVPLRTPDNR